MGFCHLWHSIVNGLNAFTVESDILRENKEQKKTAHSDDEFRPNGSINLALLLLCFA